MTKYIRGAALILIKDKKALMMLRDNKPEISYPNHWSITGGSVEKGESPKQAAMRELREETGYISKNPIKFSEAIYTDDKGRHIHAFRYYEIYDGLQQLNCYEGQKIAFLSTSEIKNKKVFPGQVESAIEAIRLANKAN